MINFNDWQLNFNQSNICYFKFKLKKSLFNYIKILIIIIKFAESNKVMTKWIRFDYKDDLGLFGILDSDYVDEHEGDLFENPKPTGR